MHHTTSTIYKAILRRAAAEWGISDPHLIEQGHDPLIRFLIGVCAQELGNVYAHLQQTETRLQDRLTRTLLPEYWQYPRPAHALATVEPTQTVLDLPITEAFARHTKGYPSYYFAPLQPTRLLKQHIKIVATEAGLLNDLPKNALVKTLLVGIETPALPEAWQNICLYFDLPQVEAVEKQRFLYHVQQSKMALNGQLLETYAGFPKSGDALNEFLEGEKDLQTWVQAAYQQQFVTIQVQKAIVNLLPTKIFLEQYFDKKWIDKIIIEDNLQKTVLTWLSIELPMVLEASDWARHLQIRFNVFPVINRQQQGQQPEKRFFVKEGTIACLPVAVDNHFAGIRLVRTENGQPLPYRPLMQLAKETTSTFSVHHSNINKQDHSESWQRLSELLKELQEECVFQQAITPIEKAFFEKTASILKQKMENKETNEIERQIYVYIQSSAAAKQARYWVEYWSCQGALANRIPAKSMLETQNKDLDAHTLQLITETQGGTNAPNAENRLNHLRHLILNRGRLVTLKDIETFCYNSVSEPLKKVTVRSNIGLDPRKGFGMTRFIEVILTPASSPSNTLVLETERLRILLESKSVSTIPFKVTLN